jgi:hypothetical protein
MNSDFEQTDYLESEIEIPLNVLKEKILFSIPPDSSIDDDAVIAISYALKHFLKLLSDKINFENNEEKKILVKDIKTSIENEKVFSFLKKLIDK